MLVGKGEGPLMDETTRTPMVLPLLLLPLISGLASYFELHYVLLVAFLAVGLTVFFALRDENTPDLFFIVLIWSISLSLILASALVSTNLRGWDIQDEYRTSSEVLTLHRWNTAENGLYNSVLSLTLFVPMVTITSGLNLLVVYRLLLPIIYSIIPIILYKIYRTILQKRAAFLATFLFMSFPTFYDEMLQLGRQEIAEIILLGLIFVLLGRRRYTRTVSGALAVTMLGVGFLAAHYSLAFIFTSFFLFSFVMPRILPRRAAPLTDLNILLTLFISAFALYTFVAGGAAINQLGTVFSNAIADTFGSFLSSTSRPTVVLLATGAEAALPGPLHIFNRVTQYLVQVFIVLGFFTFAIKKQKTLTEMQMVPLMTAALLFLGAAVTLPFVANALQVTRIYHLALLFLAPCFVIGVEKICSLGKNVATSNWTTLHLGYQLPRLPHLQRKWVLAAAILACYFLFVGGWMWSATMDIPTSVVLDGQRMRDSTNPLSLATYRQDFLESQDVAAAVWLKAVRSMNNPICADGVTRYGVLTSYGGIPRTGPESVNDFAWCPFRSSPQSYVYFSQYNTVAMTAYSAYGSSANGILVQYSTSTLQPSIQNKNRIFSDGAAIYS